MPGLLLQACEEHVKALVKESTSECDRAETSVRHCRDAAAAATAEAEEAEATCEAAACSARAAHAVASAAARAAAAAAAPLPRLQRRVAAATGTAEALLRDAQAERQRLWDRYSVPPLPSDGAAADLESQDAVETAAGPPPGPCFHHPFTSLPSQPHNVDVALATCQGRSQPLPFLLR